VLRGLQVQLELLEQLEHAVQSDRQVSEDLMEEMAAQEQTAELEPQDVRELRGSPDWMEIQDEQV